MIEVQWGKTKTHQLAKVANIEFEEIILKVTLGWVVQENGML